MSLTRALKKEGNDTEGEPQPLNRILGAWARPGNLNGTWVRDPVAWGLEFDSCSGSVRARGHALGLVLAFVLPNRMKSCSVRSWMIPGGSWMSSGGY